jgi:hypothetical protein
MFYSDTFPQIIQSLWLSRGKMLSGFAIGHLGQRRVPLLVMLYKNYVVSKTVTWHCKCIYIQTNRIHIQRLTKFQSQGIDFKFHLRHPNIISYPSPRHKSPLVGQWLIIQASQSHSLDTPQWIGFPWTSDQPDAVTSSRHHKTLTRKTGVHVPVGIRSRNPRKWATADPRLKQCGHRDKHDF